MKRTLYGMFWLAAAAAAAWGAVTDLSAAFAPGGIYADAPGGPYKGVGSVLSTFQPSG